jgi:hypothetical protein
MQGFTLDSTVIAKILTDAKPMGHHEDAESLNLGFGFLYYGVVRVLRPKHTLVIGSGFGFSVVCLGLGLKDNNRGKLTFVDPSYSLLKHGPFKTIGGRGKWEEPENVREHFAGFGVDQICTHYKLSSEEFFSAYKDLALPKIDLAFIDGHHGFKQVRHDFLQTMLRSRRNSYIFLHDTNIIVREMLHHSGVKRWLKRIRRQIDYFDVIDFPFSSGVALVRLRRNGTERCFQ